MSRISVAFLPVSVIALMLIWCPRSHAEKIRLMTPARIDVFTTLSRPASSMDAFMRIQPKVPIHVYVLDRIKQFEGKLSVGLPADPVKAKSFVLRRLQRLSEGSYERLEHSATALSKAVRYGVEKYPAIVFDGDLVVYGLTDLSLALMHYRHWRARGTS